MGPGVPVDPVAMVEAENTVLPAVPAEPVPHAALGQAERQRSRRRSAALVVGTVEPNAEKRHGAAADEPDRDSLSARLQQLEALIPAYFPTEGGNTAYAFYYAPKNPDYKSPQGSHPPLIVKSHGGAISIRSKLKKGTTIEVFFPKIDEEVLVETDRFKELPKGTEKILFVDDEEVLKKLQASKKKPQKKSGFQKKLEDAAKKRGYNLPKK